jgi:hypothetical protein
LPLSKTSLVTLLLVAGCASVSQEQREQAVFRSVLDQEALATLVGKPVSSGGARTLAARELECTLDAVTVWDYSDHVRIAGCNRVAFFLKTSSTEWERAGPRFDLTPDELTPPGFDARAVKLTRLAGETPYLSQHQLKRLTEWTPTVTSHCILRTDGTLHQCFVVGSEAFLAELISDALATFRYAPVKMGDRAVPTPVVLVFTWDIKKPNCSTLSSPMRRFRCEQAVKAN